MKNHKLRWLYVLFIILLIIFQAVFIKYWYEKTLDDIGMNAINIAKAVANTIDIDKYEGLIQDRKKNDYFAQMQAYFLKVQQQTGVKYLYVEHKISESEIEYIFDAEKDSFGETDENSTPEAHTSKNSLHTRLESYTVWGTLISGYTPLINRQGQIVGAVGVDVDESFFYQELRKRLSIILLNSVMVILLFSTLIFRLQREITARQKAQASLLETTESLRNILNNTNQGFLVLNPHLLIEAEYSIKCEDLLGKNLAGQFFPQVVFPDDGHQASFMANILQEILAETDAAKKEVYMPLIPTEVMIDRKYIEIEYKLIQDHTDQAGERIMVILNDVTDKFLMQKQREDEKKVLKMVVQAVVNRDDFLETIKDYRRFCQQDFLTKSQEGSVQETLSGLFISIHTFKGSFSQLEMINVVEALHQFESRLSEMKQRAHHITAGDLNRFLQEYRPEEWLNRDLSLIEEVLGEEFLNQEPVIEESKLVRLEQKLSSLLPPNEYSLVQKELRRLRYRPFKVLLQAYPQYALKLAERFEKPLRPFRIEGGDFEVNTSHYLNFTKALVHVFRNCVDHGLETVDERIDACKEEFGQIKCTVASDSDLIVLTIADDGRGVNLDSIRNKALEKEICSPETVDNMSDSEVLLLIFSEELSSKDEVTEFSGRGVGLSAVKQELDRISGRVEVISTPGQGTGFKFYLPMPDES